MEDYLRIACKSGHLGKIQNYISKQRGGNYSYLLVEACQVGDINIVNYLLELGDNNTIDVHYKGESSLYKAFHHKHYDIADLLLNLKQNRTPNVNADDGKLLYELCENNNKEGLRILLNACKNNNLNINLNARNGGPFEILCINGYDDMIQMLLKYKTYNNKNNLDVSINQLKGLKEACKNNHVNTIKTVCKNVKLSSDSLLELRKIARDKNYRELSGFLTSTQGHESFPKERTDSNRKTMDKDDIKKRNKRSQRRPSENKRMAPREKDEMYEFEKELYGHSDRNTYHDDRYSRDKYNKDRYNKDNHRSDKRKQNKRPTRRVTKDEYDAMDSIEKELYDRSSKSKNHDEDRDEIGMLESELYGRSSKSRTTGDEIFDNFEKMYKEAFEEENKPNMACPKRT